MSYSRANAVQTCNTSGQQWANTGNVYTPVILIETTDLSYPCYLTVYLVFNTIGIIYLTINKELVDT